MNRKPDWLIRFLLAVILFCCALLASGQRLSRRLAPGDFLEINSEALGQAPVDVCVGNEGLIVLAKIGQVSVAGLSSSDAATKVRSLLVRAGFPDAAVLVSFRFLRGAPIEVLGAVKKPFRLRFSHGAALESVIAAAEPAEQADCNHISVFHADGGTEVVSLATAYRLTDGDRVEVGWDRSSHAIEVVGGVVHPVQLSIQSRTTLAEVIERAGGLSPLGDPDRVVIIRAGESIPVSLQTDGRFQIEVGDAVRVGIHENAVHLVVQGNVIHPGLIDFREGMTLTQAIQQAGGVKNINADDLVCLSKSMGDNSRKATLSLRFIREHRIPDPLLKAGDLVEVLNAGSKSR